MQTATKQLWASVMAAFVGFDMAWRAVKEGIFAYASDWQTADFIGIVMPSVSAQKMQCGAYRNFLTPNDGAAPLT
jgi:hypothetical protein